MGKRTAKSSRSQTLPSSPSHSFSSSSSSDFEFTISVSPRQASTALCPADELFYKGQLLPLHLSPRLSMVRTLILASSSTSSSSDTNSTSASRDSTGSSTESHSSFSSDIVLLGDCDSSRPSSVTEDDEFRARFGINNTKNHKKNHSNPNLQSPIKKSKYFSLSRFSSVFRKESTTKNNNPESETVSGSQVKKISSSAKEVFRKYLNKVKPLYGKISQKQQQQNEWKTKSDRSGKEDKLSDVEFSSNNSGKESGSRALSHSFSGNLKYPRRRNVASSCPSSIRSSPSHSGILSSRTGLSSMYSANRVGTTMNHGNNTSSMEELQSAIQGAIAHCKSSMCQSHLCLLLGGTPRLKFL
ncbi:putative membrane-associated kinase regulator 1 [Cucumis melo var. makuwa]|uniref:Membrane-associated kinase regulator 1 n=1 Tax=Cucumis melo var. makuwa TaxID=1194695 RepID=A0A5D3DCI0_CUCMM|nr:putative membrane-associated kinase regulator 1 [Cucumis melo var. makuwa]TYK21180.1 putative membrane-associated kinase regulator 1 [Cucumis melo var. makuwa]